MVQRLGHKTFVESKLETFVTSKFETFVASKFEAFVSVDAGVHSKCIACKLMLMLKEGYLRM